MGMGNALETLCGQAYGAGRLDILGIYLQRSWIILIASSIHPSVPTVYIFKFLGQEVEISRLAGKFTVSIIPQMFALAVSFANEKFLQAQSKVMVLAWIGFGALLVHIGLLCLFIFGLKWGMAGAAASYNVSFWLVSIHSSGHIYITRWCKGSWTGLSWSAFKEIWSFVRLSISSAVMICLEVWYMMMLTLLAGHLKNAETNIASIAICLNIDTWEFMVFVGLHAAISVRVSNELGSGGPRATKYAVIVAVVESLTIGLFCMALILATRNYFSIIFTNDKDLQKAVAKIAYLLGITMLLNSIHPVIAGVAIGSGWRGLMAFVNVGCYYIFGLPLGLVSGYVLHRGVPGIWGGMLCGTVRGSDIDFSVHGLENYWKAEATKASKRVESWAEQGETANSQT